MITVRSIKDWSYPDINRQTPGCTGIWQDIKFIQDDLPCEYVVVLNTPLENCSVACPKGNLWLFLQEPPNEISGWMQNGRNEYARIYTTDPERKGARFIRTQTALPWHVDKDYDFLKCVQPAEKSGTLSWITSSKTNASGHRLRMAFLERLQNELSFDLYGCGFSYITDKWDGLSPYRYSVAVESHSNPYYWTEKLTDCFLAWTMPIYYGCSKITDYFPDESMIRIDINDPNAVYIIQDAIEDHRWEKNLDAIAYARSRILDEYQFFPFMRHEIMVHRQECPVLPPSRTLNLVHVQKPVSRLISLKNQLNKYSFYRVLKHTYKRLKKTPPK